MRQSALKRVVVIGSSRKDGNTRQVVDDLSPMLDFDILDLNDYQFGYYDYGLRDSNDDFLALIKRMVNEYDVFIFATPVYWYSMSGIMKMFFDRITDLLDIEKELGRKLRSKNMAVVTSSIGNHLGNSFWFPFIETAKYLGMNYIGNIHTIVNEDYTENLKFFAESLENH